MSKYSAKELCVRAMLCAVVCVATMVIQIPIAANGYIHLGDSIIIFAGAMFGPMTGLAAGGVGSAFADLLSGYGYWMPFTLVIKGVMGYAVGKIAYDGTDKIFGINKICGVIASEVIMVVGYFAAGTVLSGSLLVSLTSVPPNIVQSLGGGLAYFIIAYGFKKTGVLKMLS